VIDYYFATMSPWAYLGHARFTQLAATYQQEVRVLPADLGAVFAKTGGVPLGQRSPERQAYRLEELARWRDFLGLPLTLKPAYFPVSGELSSLAIHACVKTHGAAKAMALSGAMLKAVWAQERNIADLATLSTICSEQGLSMQTLDLEAARPAYADATQQALAAGVFGAPWFRFNGASFWGQDRLEFLERALQQVKA
jgi:2-hydroxychromene-2-carboxylate isomerase